MTNASSNGNHGSTNPLQLIASSRPAQVYLAAVAATGLFVAVSQATHTAPDANLAGVWALFVTLPWSLPATMALPDLGESGNVAAFAGVVALSAVVNATLIAWVTRTSRNRRS
ncbi:hypothetical protein Kisp01_27310 [Kineosporia sp. NBRC 101677]|uniref:SCO4225 family membrane protein n=1 Tax=Kineosporia sp. NBRC 101677 TaxID=3032197 RepID=UPI0024A3F47E|nr:hypothetical protein [Kineosporia sp. NBRC 101677]GLY15716.1 hypothetical protein Kisp01_27310 [Kineosporia sp. NBRC 101677]